MVSFLLNYDTEWYHCQEVTYMYFPKIKDLREDHDMTQQDVADYLNMNRNVYRRYESGEREIPVWALIELAKLYKVSVDYLVDMAGR